MPPYLQILPPASPVESGGDSFANASPNSSAKAARNPHPLQEGKPGRYRIMSMQLAAAERDLLYRRGLIEGRILTLVHNDFRGRLVVYIDGRHVILGRKQVHRILVRGVPGHASGK